MSITNSTKRGGCIVLLDVPPCSSITLDGITRITPSSQPQLPSQAQGFNGGLFIIDNITSDTTFHLLIVRPGVHEKINQNHGGSLPVGFILLSNSTSTSNNFGYDWIFARRYNQQTEEISNESLDEVTSRNLMTAITDPNGELVKFTMSYEQFMGSNDSGRRSIASWKGLTALVDGAFLHKQHGLHHGDKMVPSSDTCHDNSGIIDSEIKTSCNVIDGKPTSYPSIPCIDTNVSAQQLTRHVGTKFYMSELTPNLRTWLLFGGQGSVASGNLQCTCPEEYIWKDILKKHYNGDGNEKQSQYFLADIQFSFLIFIFLECHASLEHWRDAVSMSSLTIKSATSDEVQNHSLIHNSTFTLHLLKTLHTQLSYIEIDFFHESEYSSGENNFLIGALRRLCRACDTLHETTDTITLIKGASLKLQKLTSSRFDVQLFQSPVQDLTDCEIDMTNDSYPTKYDKSNTEEHVDNEDILDEDGPVIVPCSEVEASMTRSSLLDRLQVQKYNVNANDDDKMQKINYPLLFAAIVPHEDVLMTCARILDTGNDVSLVREAAAYLEEVEAQRR